MRRTEALACTRRRPPFRAQAHPSPSPCVSQGSGAPSPGSSARDLRGGRRAAARRTGSSPPRGSGLRHPVPRLSCVPLPVAERGQEGHDWRWRARDRHDPGGPAVVPGRRGHRYAGHHRWFAMSDRGCPVRRTLAFLRTCACSARGRKAAPLHLCGTPTALAGACPWRASAAPVRPFASVKPIPLR